jgi:hypothetical protein
VLLPVLAALLLSTQSEPAQRSREPRLDITLPAPSALTDEGPVVTTSNVVSDGKVQELLQHGIPISLNFRVELWTTAGMFDQLLGRTEWSIVIRYEHLSKTYRVLRVTGTRVQSLASSEKYATVVAEVERPQRAPIAAENRRDRQYYAVSLDVVGLSADDLDELESWLRGELGPAVRGKRNPGTALTRGVRTLLARLLGAERRHLARRSPTFRAR